MPKIIVFLTPEDLAIAIEALDYKINWSEHGEAVKFKNVRAEFQNILIKLI